MLLIDKLLCKRILLIALHILIFVLNEEHLRTFVWIIFLHCSYNKMNKLIDH